MRAADTNGDGFTDPIETSLEWGVRSLGKRVSVNAEGDLPADAVADVFPAYDDDGGPADRPHPRGIATAMGSRRRHLFILLFVLGLGRRSRRWSSSPSRPSSAST